MTVTTIQGLFFCLIPLGIFLLIKGIPKIIKSFNGKILLEMPLAEKSGQFFWAY